MQRLTQRIREAEEDKMKDVSRPFPSCFFILSILSIHVPLFLPCLSPVLWSSA